MYQSKFKSTNFSKKHRVKEAVETSYEANIFVDTYEDDFEDGEIDRGTSWNVKVKDKTFMGLLKKIADEVNAPSIKDLDYQGEVNDYSDSTELWYSYMADGDNNEATKKQIEAWKTGDLRLWNAQCHILCSKIGKTKLDKQDLKQGGFSVGGM